MTLPLNILWIMDVFKGHKSEYKLRTRTSKSSNQNAFLLHMIFWLNVFSSTNTKLLLENFMATRLECDFCIDLSLINASRQNGWRQTILKLYYVVFPIWKMNWNNISQLHVLCKHLFISLFTNYLYINMINYYLFHLIFIHNI
jgi:hypothetical protein